MENKIFSPGYIVSESEFTVVNSVADPDFFKKPDPQHW